MAGIYLEKRVKNIILLALALTFDEKQLLASVIFYQFRKGLKENEIKECIHMILQRLWLKTLNSCQLFLLVYCEVDVLCMNFWTLHFLKVVK